MSVRGELLSGGVFSGEPMSGWRVALSLALVALFLGAISWCLRSLAGGAAPEAQEARVRGGNAEVPVVVALALTAPEAAATEVLDGASFITGDVADELGEPVAEAVVEMTSSTTSELIAQATTDEKGRYRVKASAADSFRVRAPKCRYSSSDVEAVTLPVGSALPRLTMARLPSAA